MGFISAPGPLELMVILVVALIVLGPERLPEAARSVGKGMREFKESLTAVDDEPDPYDEPTRPVASQPERGSPSRDGDRRAAGGLAGTRSGRSSACAPSACRLRAQAGERRPPAARWVTPARPPPSRTSRPAGARGEPYQRARAPA